MDSKLNQILATLKKDKLGNTKKKKALKDKIEPKIFTVSS